MEKEYWLGRWNRGDTAWHQTEVEPNLIKHFSGLKPTRVFVPLCGKSMDLAWLASQGHEVIGAEISESAICAFFDENKIPCEKSRADAFTVYRGGKVTIFCGDVFDLKSQNLSGLGAVYDRAALIAFPQDMRRRYAEHMTRMICESADRNLFFLQIALERTPHDEKGPPFSVCTQELNTLYGNSFTITPLSREEVDMGPKTKSKTEECVYRLALQ